MTAIVAIEKWPITGGFTISRETKYDAVVVTVTLERNGFSGMGECVPLKRYNYTPEGVKQEIDTWLIANHNWDRETLLQTMPAGPARFALDTAMWQLEAAEKDMPLWQYAGLEEFPHDIKTAFTLSVAAPEIMAERAIAHKEFHWLKIKLMGDGLDQTRLQAIHAVVPDMPLIVDANEALSDNTLQRLLPIFHSCNVCLIEQPLPAGKDTVLNKIQSTIPLAADESCHTAKDLADMQGKYQVANIKLDKTGGLTEALRMKKQAEEMGMKIMVGCMPSTSLSILPAFLLAQDAAYIDLDGALLLEKDRPGSKLAYRDGMISLLS